MCYFFVTFICDIRVKNLFLKYIRYFQLYSEPDTTQGTQQGSGDQQQQSSLDFNLDDLEAFMSDQMSKTTVVQKAEGILFFHVNVGKYFIFSY